MLYEVITRVDVGALIDRLAAPETQFFLLVQEPFLEKAATA